MSSAAKIEAYKAKLKEYEAKGKVLKKTTGSGGEWDERVAEMKKKIKEEEIPVHPA
jgi:hypothetical protein